MSSDEFENRFVIDIQTATYRRENKTLLNNVSWQVREQEHWAILGLNGSGKTTLLNMINGYIWPTTGTVSVLSEAFGTIDLRELRKSIGWVSSSLQEKLYGRDLTQDVVLSGKYATIGLYDRPESDDYDKASALMEQLGCKKLWDRPYVTCSQGEKQKVLIARALMAWPRLLILDEPCNGLDLFSRETLLSGVDQLAAGNDAPTILFVTHHTEEILPIFRHTLLLRRGEVYGAGETMKLLTPDLLSGFFETPVDVHWRSNRAWVTV
ncbi:ABC transporter ATP-binding protein [Paenibacillus allorhizosphaerae]|uniref:ABC transporter ATP-binding protein YlmA n=1 Tax=Paenibacillus allorhizosphaerae TaxID=2849866 RepID=A0ABN7TWT2_9BACL|nr:ABC transporter ATP-binding protein [Paenibacillus allorhizosphaerae]CAG7655294.1 putative ABC transporter ATP-binding protein YlmA [Paenibacillus allorhizosphaerae]